MPRGFGRLPFFGRRTTRGGASPGDDTAATRPPIDPDLAPIGPPVLVPSAIIRQVLVDATELIPSWAMPRTQPPAGPPPVEPKPTKRPRRPKATERSAARTAATKPRRRARTSSDDSEAPS